MNSEISPELGDLLKNGARIIASQPRSSDDFIVLAHWDGEYVTWSAYHDGVEWVTVSGHYFSDITEAAIDFRKRGGGNMQEIKEWVDEIVSGHVDA